MKSIIKGLWTYAFSEEIQDEFAKQVKRHFATHPEIESMRRFSESIGIDHGKLSQLINKKPGAGYGLQLRFHHLVLFYPKGIVKMEELNLGNSTEETQIRTLCNAIKDDETWELLMVAGDLGIDLKENLKRMITEAKKGQ